MAKDAPNTPDLSVKESEAILSNAADMRPDENFHGDPALKPKGPRGGRELTAEEAAAIMSLAANIRPDENFHGGED